jgi:hypothetical protein
MARSKNSERRRELRKRKKALKRKRKQSSKDAARSAATDRSAEYEGAMSLMAALLADAAAAQPLPTPPDWACAASYTPAAARMVASGRALPGSEMPPPHHVAKLEAWLGIDRPWGLLDVRTRTTEELVAALERHGTTVDRATFAERARGRRSAWKLGQDLVDGADPAHLPGAVATELWRRWLPDTPCYESVCDSIQRGYPLLDDSTGEKPIALWMDAWRDLSHLLPARISSFRDVARETGMLQLPGNWVGDMMQGVMNVALSDEAFVSDALAFVRWARRFDDAPLSGVVADEAELLAISGAQEQGIAILEACIEADPRDPMPVARLADLLTLNHPRVTTDYTRAAAVLRDGMARSLRDPESWGLASRLEWIESRAASTSEEPVHRGPA